MRLTVIGCSGLFPSADSPASSYLVETQDSDGRLWKILLDLGSGALGGLQRLMSLRDLDAILLSNLDLDHCADLWSLYIAIRYGPFKPSCIPLYGPSGTLARLIDIGSPHVADRIAQVYDFIEWSDRSPIALGPFLITPYRVNHPGISFGLRFEDGPSTIAYTGDTDICPALTTLVHRADLLVADATYQEQRDLSRNVHMTGHRAGQVAAEGNVGRLVLTHLPIWTDRQVILTEATASYKGQLQIAQPDHIYHTP